jgi:mono/diheme cytochrome c family protein
MLKARSPRGSHCLGRARSATTVGALALALIARAAAEPGAQGAQTAGRTVSDGAYAEAQAERGKMVYEQHCAFCHLSDLRGQGFAPSLVEDTFLQRWQDGNLGDLLTIVKATMPQDKPASLTDKEYGEIVAYLLKANNYVAGQQELIPDPAVLKDVTFRRLGSP